MSVTANYKMPSSDRKNSERKFVNNLFKETNRPSLTSSKLEAKPLGRLSKPPMKKRVLDSTSEASWRAFNNLRGNLAQTIEDDTIEEYPDGNKTKKRKSTKQKKQFFIEAPPNTNKIK